MVADNPQLLSLLADRQHGINGLEIEAKKRK